MSYDKLLPHIIEFAQIEDRFIKNEALDFAKLSFYDWLIVSCAGKNEPVAQIIRDYVSSESGVEIATVTGSSRKFPARAAALANGTISHALDYDDTHFLYVGHPSVAIFPSVLAVAQELNVTIESICKAFLIGAEVACRIGLALGRKHYNAGFHQTATSGCFGATAALARLCKLNERELRMALGLASTKASGLKSQFGTMGKPYNAGVAAANAVEACWLAQKGFTSAYDGIGGLQGYLLSHHSMDPRDIEISLGIEHTDFKFVDIKYKLHACCHGTHAMIEALKIVIEKNELTADNISRLLVVVNPRWLSVCNIQKPKTGLEIKFSFSFIAAMVFYQIDTASPKVYNDKLCQNEKIVELAEKVEVSAKDSLHDGQTILSVITKNGKTFEANFDIMKPINKSVLTDRLLSKAETLVGNRKAKNIWKTLTESDNSRADEIAHFLI